MKIITKTKNFELTDGMQIFVDTKLASLKKFIDVLKEDAPGKGKSLAEVFVELGKETAHHRKGNIFTCQLDVKLPGRRLVVKANSDDLNKAVVGARKELEREIKEYKVKKIEKNLRQRRKSRKEINF